MIQILLILIFQLLIQISKVKGICTGYGIDDEWGKSGIYVISVLFGRIYLINENLVYLITVQTFQERIVLEVAKK